jgi:hypothetical protein
MIGQDAWRPFADNTHDTVRWFAGRKALEHPRNAGLLERRDIVGHAGWVFE